MLAVATGVFVYYSVWVLVLPFIDADSFLQSFFLPRDYAIKLPLLLLVTAIFGVTAFFANVIVKNAQKEKLKKSKKAN